MSLAALGLLCPPGVEVARAQTPHTLVPILTSQPTNLTDLPDQFGIPVAGVTNAAGDYAFIGLRGSGLYYRKAGTPTTIRVIQFGEELPGMAGSRLFQLFGPLQFTPSGLVVVRADVVTTERLTSAILTFDGTTLRTVVSGLDTAPGTGGKPYGRTLTLADVNNNGDVLIGASLLPIGSTDTALPTAFLLPAAGPAVRVVGPGDAAPGTGGTFTAVTPIGLTTAGQVLFSASISGGSGATGLFAWQGGVTRRIVAQGDPTPVGGVFSDTFTTVVARQVDSGMVMFMAASSLWENTSGGGTVAAVVSGSAAPPEMGGTFTAVTGFPAMGPSHDAVFIATVSGGASVSGLFRYRSGVGTELVARVGQAVPDVPGTFFGVFLSPSVNAVGTVSFQGNAGGLPVGIFQKTAGGPLVSVVLHGAPLPAPVGGQLFLAGFPTQTLAGNVVSVRGHVLNGPDAHHAHLLYTGGVPALLMTTADRVPPGARLIVRPMFLTAAGQHVGMSVQLSGARESVGVFNPTTQTGRLLASDGDPFGGGRLQWGTLNSVPVNASGDIVAPASIFGGVGLTVRNALILGGLQTPGPALITADGELDNLGRPLTGALLNLAGIRPPAVNAAGTVAFTALAGGQRNVFVGSSASAVAQKIAMVGEMVSTGTTLTAINAVHGGINDAGQVLFSGSTTAGAGLFIGQQGQTPVTVVQVGNAAPGGGTFSGFGAAPQPGFNNAGQVLFAATVTGGTGGGLFLYTPGQPLEAIALNSSSSPAGGTFVLTTARPGPVINDAGHIVFVADLSGGPADSGVFVKRGPLAGIETVAVQGNPAPGTGGVFETFVHGTLGLVGERVQISETGQVAFAGQVVLPDSTRAVGWWHAEPGGAIQPIVVSPSAGPEFDGGTAGVTGGISSWMTGDRLPMYVALADGPHAGGLYLYVPVFGAATGTGSNVVVMPPDVTTGGTPVMLTFSSVTGAGVTRLTRSATGPRVPRAYRLGAVAPYFEVETTASYTGPIAICVDAVGHEFAENAVIRLLHYNGAAWVDVTTSGPVGSIICGEVSALSPFVVAHALNVPSSNILQNGDFSAGLTGWQTFQPGTIVHNGASNGVFEYHRADAGAAVVLQDTDVTFNAGDPIVAHFDLGNSDPAWKRVSVLIHQGFAFPNQDLSVCTFWLPPGAPMRTYAMRTHTTVAWAGASISFYAASVGTSGGQYRLDNVVMGPGHGLTVARTDCVDPLEPGVGSGPDGPGLIINGDFSNGLSSWIAFGSAPDFNPPRLDARVTAGVAEFIRPDGTPPSGVLLQPTGVAIPAGRIVTATFRMGNSSGVRKRVTVLLHDLGFTDLTACTFWLAPGQLLSAYAITTFVARGWSNATISFYPAVVDTLGWYELDNVAMHVTPAALTYGTDCVEPGDTSGLSQAAPVPDPDPESTLRPESMRDALESGPVPPIPTTMRLVPANLPIRARRRPEFRP